MPRAHSVSATPTALPSRSNISRLCRNRFARLSLGGNEAVREREVVRAFRDVPSSPSSRLIASASSYASRTAGTSFCQYARPPAAASALARATVRPAADGRSRTAVTQRRPSERWPARCQKRHSAPTIRSPISPSSFSIAQRRAARRLSCSVSRRIIQGTSCGPRSSGSASSASRRNHSAWRRSIVGRWSSASSRSSPNSLIVCSMPKRTSPSSDFEVETRLFSARTVRPVQGVEPQRPRLRHRRQRPLRR